MEKRYQVFVSSTFVDLQDARKEVMQALLELDCIPSGMELFPAADEDQWSLIKKVIDDSDYYLVILAGRYGSIGPVGYSYTEMEYRYAVDTGKPIIGFMHKNPGQLPADFCEGTDEGKVKLEEFRKLIRLKPCKFWESPAELGSQVSRSLVKLIKSNPAVGWVRADLLPTESAAEEMLGLRRKIDELQNELQSARPDVPEGTSDLAQGKNIFSLRYSYFGYSSGANASPGEVIGKHELTWNYIFSVLSPLMIHEAPDEALIAELSSTVKSLVFQAMPSDERPQRMMSFQVSDADYQTIKIQLRALGYIAKSIKPRSVKDTSTYWTLTPFGDTVMTRLRAQRKPAQEKTNAPEAKS